MSIEYDEDIPMKGAGQPEYVKGLGLGTPNGEEAAPRIAREAGRPVSEFLDQLPEDQRDVAAEEIAVAAIARMGKEVRQRTLLRANLRAATGQDS